MFLDIIAVTNIGGRVNIVVRGVNITVVGGDKHRSAEKANKLLDFKWVLLHKKYMEMWRNEYFLNAHILSNFL